MNNPHKSQSAAMDRAGELPDGEQLRECINSGQVSAAQVVAHAEAGELREALLLLVRHLEMPISVQMTKQQLIAKGRAALSGTGSDEVARLREALERIIKSRDERAFTKEEFRTDEHLPDGYWSPAASMVDSESIAHARNLLAALSGTGSDESKKG